MTDSEDSNDTAPTNLDLIRLEDLEIGGTVHGESHKWSVFRYKDQYLVLTEHVSLDFKTIEGVISYLKS